MNSKCEMGNAECGAAEPLTYKGELTRAMGLLAADPLVCFLGYGIQQGRALWTLKGVSDAQLIETPVAENLMVGLAIGLALKGRRPVVFIERCDFLLNALDAIVNHLDKMEMLSRGEFVPGIILRVVVGGKMKPLYTGVTHTQDFTEAMWKMVNFRVHALKSAEEIFPEYNKAHQKFVSFPPVENRLPWTTISGATPCPYGRSTMLVEYRDLM